MNIKSIIAALAVVGSSSVALAQPVTYATQTQVVPVVRDQQPLYRTLPAVRPIYRPAPVVVPVHRPAPVNRPTSVDDCNNTRLGGDLSVYTGQVGTKYGYGWAELTRPTRIDRGREFIKIGGAAAGRFDTIKLENRSGSSFIQEIGIQFANGTTQVVKLDQRLSAGNPCITVDLTGNHRAINQIIVYGSTARHSSYQILAA